MTSNEDPKYQKLTVSKSNDVGECTGEQSEDNYSVCLDEDSTSNSSSSWRYFVGVLSVAIVVSTWVIMAECLQENDFIKSHEVLLRWLVVSSYSFSFLVALVLEHCCGQRSKKSENRRRFFWRTAFYTFISGWGTLFFNGYLWYLSLRETMASLNNSLYQIQCVWVYILSVLFLGERIVIRKVFAILIALGGVFLISFGNQNATGDGEQQNTAQGVIVCLISTVLFASYEVTVKIVEEKHHDKEYPLRDTLYYLGYSGMWSLFIGPLVIFGCHQLGWEHFDFPPDKASWWIVVEICLLDLLLNCGIVLGITVTTPYFISLGLLLVIPGSFFADSFLGKMKAPIGWKQIVGVALIVVGFLALQLRTGPTSIPGRLYRKVLLTKKTTIQTRSIEENTLMNRSEPFLSTCKKF